MKIVEKILLYSLLLLFCLACGFLFNCFVANRFVFKFDFNLLIEAKTWVYTGFLFMVFVCLFAYNSYKGYWRKHSKKLMESSDKDKHIMSGLETAHFQTEKELAKNFTQI